ncbi:MAG: 50S ribosomal protein L17 [Candidatus Nealsonbacteria bacterium]
MRKKKKGRKFHREKDQRKALLKTLASSLILKEKIKTTEAKAKELSSFVEKKVTKAKVGDLSSRKLLLRLFSKGVVVKLIDDLGPRYKERKGGYTRILKLGPNTNGAKMAIIEFVK